MVRSNIWSDLWPVTQGRHSKRLQQHKASPEHWTAEGGQASAMIRSLKIDFIQRVLKPRRKTPPAERRRGHAASPGAVLKHLGCLGTTHGGRERGDVPAGAANGGALCCRQGSKNGQGSSRASSITLGECPASPLYPWGESTHLLQVTGDCRKCCGI